MADMVMVMYAGRIVEDADVETIFEQPRHPYTRGLLNSLIRLETPRDTVLAPIPGLPPDLVNPPAGCSFRPRCAHAIQRCQREDRASRTWAAATSRPATWRANCRRRAPEAHA